jgi:hypothetical protein
MPLKQSYANEADIPTEQKPFYAQKDGAWQLQVEGVDSITGLVAKRDELLTKVASLPSLQGQITKLTRERDEALGGALPSGHDAVPHADAVKLQQFNAIGKPVDELKSIVTEHAALKTEAEERVKQEALAVLAEENGYDPKKIIAISDRFTMPFKKEVTVDGKKVQQDFFKVTVDGKEVERTFSEHLEADPKLKPLGDSLKATTARRGMGRDPNPVGGADLNADAGAVEQMRAKIAY